MPTLGKLEAVLKINHLPEPQILANQWRQFVIEADGLQVEVALKPKMFKKIEEINEKAEHGWVAVLTGKIGSPSASGFVLLEPNVQVFEKKPKPEVGD